MCGSGYALPLRATLLMGLRPRGIAPRFNRLLTAGQSHRLTSGGIAARQDLLKAEVIKNSFADASSRIRRYRARFCTALCLSVVIPTLKNLSQRHRVHRGRTEFCLGYRRTSYRMQLLQRPHLNRAAVFACADGFNNRLRAGHRRHTRNVVLQSGTANCLLVKV